jgi:hypothetical protein
VLEASLVLTIGWALKARSSDILAWNIRKWQLSVLKEGRLRTLFWCVYFFYLTLNTTCFGCSISQPSSGVFVTQDLSTQS